MLNKSKQRVFIPLMLVGLLFFGALAAQAQDRHGDRVANGALIGATLGTLVQMVQGRTEGHQLLKGALVGGALGAAVGASQEARRDRYGRWGDNSTYRDGYYYQNGQYYQDGYAYQDGYNYPIGYDSYQGRYDGYWDGGTYRDSRPAGRYDHGSRYDYRTSHRRGDRCEHR